MPTKPRRAGLSRHTGFDGPLLQNIKNRVVETTRKEKQASPDVDAPPLSSDEDEAEPQAEPTSTTHSSPLQGQRRKNNKLEDIIAARKRASDELGAFEQPKWQTKRTKFKYGSTQSQVLGGRKSKHSLSTTSPNIHKKGTLLADLRKDDDLSSSGTTAGSSIWDKLEWNDEDEAYKNYLKESKIARPDSPDNESDTSLELSSSPLKHVDSLEDPTCPMCQASVSREFLDGFEGGRISKVAAQIRFCKAHKQNSAREQWKERGYPDIDWDGLQVRIRGNMSHVEDVLHMRVSSTFRTNMEHKLSAGKRSARLNVGGDLDDLIPGYYGSKGSRIMADTIIDHIHADLRELAPTNKVIATMGDSSFVQAVLVPEMALALIKQDMALEDSDARDVLIESRELGELLNEAENDNMVDVVSKRRRKG